VHPPLVLALPTNIKIIKPDYYELKAVIQTDIPVIKEIAAGTKELALAVARNIKNHNAVILKNHGIVTVGENLEEAFVRAQALERMSLVIILRKFQPT
jgi:L-fuculose-phosphate aldolase